MINLPARLIVWAPAGVFTSEAGPTASTLPSRAISAAFSTAGLPEPSMRRAPTKAFIPAEVAAWPTEGRSTAKAARPAQASDKQRLIHKALRRIITPFKSKRAIEARGTVSSSHVLIRSRANLTENLHPWQSKIE